jgi:hypothetical protein
MIKLSTIRSNEYFTIEEIIDQFDTLKLKLKFYCFLFENENDFECLGQDL